MFEVRVHWWLDSTGRKSYDFASGGGRLIDRSYREMTIHHAYEYRLGEHSDTLRTDLCLLQAVEANTPS